VERFWTHQENPRPEWPLPSHQDSHLDTNRFSLPPPGVAGVDGSLEGSHEANKPAIASLVAA
jgi:hypothetical protein